MKRWITMLAGFASLLFAGRAAAACTTTIAGESVAIAVPGHPFAAVPSADGCTLFASVTGQSGIAVLRNEGGAFRLTRTFALQGQPTGLALTPDGRTLVVANGDTIVLLDAERLVAGQPDVLVQSIDDGPGVGAIYAAVTPDGQTAFIADERAGRLTVVDLGARKIIGHIPQGQAPVGLAMSADGRRLYATSQSAPPVLQLRANCRPENGGGREHAEGVLFTIDVQRALKDPPHGLIAYTAAGCNPVRVTLSPDGNSAWVTARGDDKLQRFATAALERDGAKAEEVKVGRSPVGVAALGDGRRVWVSNSDRFAGPDGGGSLSLVAGEPGQPPRLLLTRPAGGFPRDLHMMPDGRTLISAEYNSQRIVLVAAPQ